MSVTQPPQRLPTRSIASRVRQWGARLGLLDEHNAGLDLAHEHRILGLIRRLCREEAIGALLVLHDLQLASRYADRVMVFKEGRVLTAGPPEHALTRDALFRAYGIDVDITAIATMASPGAPDIPALSHPVHTITY